jgi:dienelactone hydrolase
MAARSDAAGWSDLTRRAFLRRTAAAMALGPALAARGADRAEVAPIDERVRMAAKSAPLAMEFKGTTADEARRWQSAFADTLGTLLGPFRPPTAWDSVLERIVTLDDHVREERLLTADGIDPVPFHLLLPRHAAQGTLDRRPALLAIHGHGAFGHDAIVGRGDTPKFREEVAQLHYDYGLQLVRRGYVVAAPCLTPFGLRKPAKEDDDRKGDPCTVTFVGLQLLGRLLMAENLRDILWTLDFVATHPAVDPRRIGCVGLSYGGRMTMLATALDPRLRVAVIAGALNCLQERLVTGGGAGCQVIPNLLTYGDVPEIGGLIAPRPCLWQIGSRDSLLDPEWAKTALDRIGRVYRAFGAEARLHVDHFEGGHEWHGETAYPFLKDILKP